MTNKPFAIALLADKAYLEYTRQVIYSALRYGNWKGDFILLAFEIPKDSETLNWFRERKVHIIHLDKKTFSFTGIDPSKTVYFSKIYLFHPDLCHWEKIIYLDTDMIIRKDLNRLLKYDKFAAANDCFQNPLIHQLSPPGKPYEEAEILRHYNLKSLMKKSFNSGLMVIQSKSNTIIEFNKLVELTNLFGKYSLFFDQGILNLHFNESRQKIPYVYNDYYGSEPFNRRGIFKRFSDRKAVILHIIHPHKPWNQASPYYLEWKKNLDDSSQKDFVGTEGKKASIISEWAVDLVNEISIRGIYARGHICYRAWRIGSYLKRHVQKLSNILK